MIPDQISLDALNALAEKADAGVEVIDIHDLFSIVSVLSDELFYLAERLDGFVPDETITAKRWEHLITARRSMKIARRNLEAVTRR